MRRIVRPRGPVSRRAAALASARWAELVRGAVLTLPGVGFAEWRPATC